MSKKISVTNEVYYRIQALQAPRETYSQVIDRCLSTVEMIRTLPLERERGLRAKEVLEKEK